MNIPRKGKRAQKFRSFTETERAEKAIEALKAIAYQEHAPTCSFKNMIPTDECGCVESKTTLAARALFELGIISKEEYDNLSYD